jgi:hypothetical protein
MADSASRLIADILSDTLRLLDIPADMQAAAEATYDDVGLWLGDNLDSTDQWDFYAQGSMRLGTIVRPSEDDDYDIDAVAVAVAQCNITKDDTTQAVLRDCVGDALKAYVKAKAGDDKAPTACEPGKRCWTLTFKQPFHMDVLPAIPDPLALPTGIQLTDRTYTRCLWSNPIAYAHWFHGQSRQTLELRHALAKSLQVNVEDVPAWHVKTTLQQAVQAMKAHRNIHFGHDLASRPPSVLLTTLAGPAYRGEINLFEAVMGIAANMDTYIERDGRDYVVLNPVQPPDRPENFADRWGKDPVLVQKFYGWLDALQRSLDHAVETKTGVNERVHRLGASFGMSPVQKAAKQYAEAQNVNRTSSRLSATSLGAVTTGIGLTVLKDHTFHGE